MPEESDAGMMYDEVKAGELVEIGVSVFEAGFRVKITELLAESAGSMLGGIEGRKKLRGERAAQERAWVEFRGLGYVTRAPELWSPSRSSFDSRKPSKPPKPSRLQNNADRTY